MKKLLWLGAGGAEEPMIDFSPFSEVILLDARTEASANAKAHGSENIRRIDKVLTPTKKLMPLLQLSFADYSSVKQPTGLKAVFPNISVDEHIEKVTITLAEVLKDCKIEGNDNHLIIDLPCIAGDLIDQLSSSKQIERFRNISIRAGLQPLYDGSLTIAQVKKQMENSAFEIVNADASDPDIQMLHFTFNQDKASVIELTKLLDEKEAKYNEVYSWFSSRKKQAEELTLRVSNLEDENESLKSELKYQRSLSELESKFTSMFEKQRTENVEIANALGQHMTKSARQVEETCRAAVELQKLTGVSESLLPYCGYAMSAGNLLELASLIKNNSYDLIIEFGSGISTLVIAGAVRENIQETSQIVSFEQSEVFQNRTGALLQKSGLHEFVELHRVPLCKTAYSLESAPTALFYNCEAKLQELQQQFGDKKSKILVVVDGPDIDTNYSGVRYAALPMLLDHLSAHSLTIFLDDSKRDNERKVLTAWQDEAARRHVNLEQRAIETSRGAATVHVSS